jgi:hypothetical protein
MSGPVSAVEMVRLMVFSEARFQWQRINNGRPGDLFGTQELGILETPWAGGTTGDLLARMILDADFAGSSYNTRIGDEVVRLRPDWVDIILAPRDTAFGQVGLKCAGYAYYNDGDRKKTPVIFLPEEVAHFAPYPDPLANYRGMSWLTPVVREIQSDRAATQHKLKFFENAALPGCRWPEGQPAHPGGQGPRAVRRPRLRQDDPRRLHDRPHQRPHRAAPGPHRQ